MTRLLPALALLAAACTTTTTTQTIATPIARMRDGSPRPAPAYGDSCAAAIAHARHTPREPLIEPPAPKKVIRPPFDPPDRLRGQIVTFVFDVDSAGHVTAARMEPAEDRFLRRLLADYAAQPFHPALLRGCGVPATARIMIEYPR